MKNNSCAFKVVLLFIYFLTGCATTAQKPVAVKYSSENVLHKLGDKKPILSKISEDNWILIASYEDPTVDSIYANLAIGESESAIQLAKNYIANSPNNLDAFEALSRALLSNRQTALAAYYAGYVLEKDKTRVYLNNIIGLNESLSANTVKQYDQAKATFKKALNASPPSLAAGLNLGHLELETGAASKAIQVFQKVAALCDDCYPALLGIGIAQRRLGNYSASINSLEKVSNRSYSAAYHLSLSLRASGNLAEAKDVLQDIVSNAPASEEIIINKAEALLFQLRIEMDNSNNEGTQDE